MRAIIPVAGVGSRLKPHTHTIPKVLLNVGGKPIIAHIIDKLLAEGINKATFIYGHLGEMIINYINKTYPALKANFVEQHEPKGLGHAIYTAIPTFDDKEIFIILGDTIFDVDIKPVIKNKTTALGVKEVEDPRRFGVAIMENGFIKKLVEKPQTQISKLALVGLYYIKNSDSLKKSLTTLVKKDIKTRDEYQLTDALQLMLDGGEKMTTFNVEGWYDCGKPETLLSTNQYLLKQKSFYKKNIPSTVIIPPVYISNNAEIENSIIGPFATIDDGVKINDSIIRNSIVGANSHIGKVMLENSIIGNNSIIKGNYKKLNTGDSSEIEFY
jgi:glucose-1-phosphate thymidylyltransferase